MPATRRTIRIERWLHRLAILLTVLTVLFLMVRAWSRPEHEGDTKVLVTNVIDSLSCFSKGHDLRCPQIGQFPLYQFLPAFALAALGLSHGHILDVLTWINFAAGLSIFLLIGLHFRKRPPSGLVAMLLLTCGYFTVYLNSSFGEILAALALLLLTLRLMRPPGSRGFEFGTAVLAYYCVLTKETALPFTVLLILAALTRSPRPWESLFRRAPGIVGALALGQTTNFLLNLSRYGSFFNRTYLDQGFIVQDLPTRISFFLGQWFSPLGGLAWFWLPGTLLIGMALLHSLRLAARKEWSRSAGLAIIPAIPLGLTLGLSAWGAPLGWSCWGHRFLIPWIPAILVLLLDHFGKELEEFARRLRPLPAFLASTALTTLLTWPHWRMLVFHSQAIQLLERGNSCPDCDLFQSIHRLLWTHPRVLLSLYDPAAVPLSTLFCGLCTLLWIYWFRRALKSLR